MIELLILTAMVAGLVCIEVWPQIKLERRLHLPDSWEPDSSRGRVAVHGGGFRVGSARVGK